MEFIRAEIPKDKIQSTHSFTYQTVPLRKAETGVDEESERYVEKLRTIANRKDANK
jgi:hypothetical protein